MKEVIVVEGRDDTRRLKEVFGSEEVVETIETNGSAIDQETLDLIAKAHEHRGVIVLTDPDYPGERIRKIISNRIPTVKHAFLTVEEALAKKPGASLGVEHASPEAIRRALSSVQTVQAYQEQEGKITKPFLVRYSLIGAEKSSLYREKLSQKLGLGHVNGKQLEKRLNLFGYDQEAVVKTLSEILEEINASL